MQHVSENKPSTTTTERSLEALKALSVRDFLKLGVSAAEFSLLSLPGISFTQGIGSGAKELFKRASGDEVELILKESNSADSTLVANGNYVCTDRLHNVQQDTKIHNLGIYHIISFIKDNKSTLFAAIRNCDILAIEGEASSADDNNSFSILSSYATKLGKQTYCIDSYNLVGELFLGNAFLAFGAGLMLLRQQLRDLNIGNASPLSKVTRGIARSIAWLCWCTSFPSPSNFNPTTPYELGTRYSKDISMAIMGRTVFMHASALDLAKRNPGKRILVVTGDAHAKLMEHFFQNPQDFDDRQEFCSRYIFPFTHNKYFKITSVK